MGLVAMTRTPNQVIADIAKGQQGCVEHSQLLRAGVSRGVIEHRLRTGYLIRRFRGVYVVAHEAPIHMQDERAALLSAGAGAFLVRRSAALAWELIDWCPRPIEISVAGVRRGSSQDLRFRSGLTYSAADVTEFGGFACTSIPRLLLDLSAEGETVLVDRLLTEARVKRRLRDGDLERYLPRAAGLRGYPALRALIEAPEGSQMTRSKAERRLRALLRRAGLPQPLVNRKLLGAERDFTWPSAKVVGEVDGWASHGTREAFERDRSRDGELTAAGWATIRITWRELTERPELVAARIAATLARRSE